MNLNARSTLRGLVSAFVMAVMLLAMSPVARAENPRGQLSDVPDSDVPDSDVPDSDVPDSDVPAEAITLVKATILEQEKK
jgi:hypothetical protein